MSHIKENGIVLIPVDFSKQSIAAIKYSFTLARHMKSKIMLLQAYAKESDMNKAELEKIAKQAAADSGMIVDTMLVKGDVFDITADIAEKIGATLIVAGLDAQVKFRSFLGKSTASKFIKNAPCPVLTLRSSSFSPEVKNIVMPFDLTMESREKVPACIQLAKYYGGEIRIVSVFDPSDQRYENKLLPYMNQVKKFIKEKSLHCTNKSIPSKEVPEALVDYANKNNCDLIVQMNNKDASFGEMFSGTASQKLVDISNVPVLTINPMKRANMPLSY